MESEPYIDLEKSHSSPLVASKKDRSVIWHSLGAFRVLGNRDYALLFCGQFISATGTQMQMVAVAWQVYLLTHSVLALGLIGLMQALPRMLFSLVGGVLADALDRRKVLLIVNAVMMLFSAIFAFCTTFQVVNLVIISVLIFLSAVASSFEFPARLAVIPYLVSREQMTDAISLDSTMVYLFAITGPTAGGLALAWFGVASTYWVTAVSYLMVLAALFVLRVPPIPAEKRAQAGFKALSEGLRFLHAHPVILALLTLDFCATFFGAPRALLPVYARDIMHIGPQGLGLLLAAGGVGAVILMPFQGLITRIKHQGLGIALAVMIWGLCVVAFGFFPNPLWLGVLFLAGTGAADMVSVLLQGIVVQSMTPDELRGRISSVMALFAIGGPMLGSFESGLVAGLFTPMFSVVSGGVACILAALLILLLVPSLLKIKIK